MSRFAVILPAAGKSSRFKDPHYKKAFAPLDNRAVWMHSAEKFVNRDEVKQVILIIAAEDREWFNMKFAANAAVLGIDIVLGGEERMDSVANALSRVQPDVDFIAIHDAARPCIAEEWIDRVFQAAERSGAAILAIPVRGTLKQVESDRTIARTVPRTGLWEAQTPQVFRRQLLLDAYAARGDQVATDDAQLVEQLGHRVKIVEGSPVNLKITTKADLRLAAQALKAMPKPKILGPVHPFADDDLWR